MHPAPLWHPAELVDFESRWRRETDGCTDRSKIDLILPSNRSGDSTANWAAQLEDYAAQNAGQPAEGACAGPGCPGIHRRGRHREPDARDAQGPGAQCALRCAAGSLPGVAGGAATGRIAGNWRAPTRRRTVRNRAVQFAIGSDRGGTGVSRGSRPAAVRCPRCGPGLIPRSPASTSNDHASAIDARIPGSARYPHDRRAAAGAAQTRFRHRRSVWFYYGARYGDYLAAWQEQCGSRLAARHRSRQAGQSEAYMALGDCVRRSWAGRQSDRAVRTCAANSTPIVAMLTITSPACCGPRAGGRSHRPLEDRAGHFSADSEPGRSSSGTFWGRVAETFTDIGERHAFGRIARRHRAPAGRLLSAKQRVPAERTAANRLPARPSRRAKGRSGWWNWAGRWTIRISSCTRCARVPDSARRSGSVAARHGGGLLPSRPKVSFGDAVTTRITQATDKPHATGLDAAGCRRRAGRRRGVEPGSPPPANRPRWDENRFRYEVEIRLASRTGTLDALLERYRSQPALRRLPPRLCATPQWPCGRRRREGARAVLEFLYDREIRGGHLEAANFLGLAEVKLQRNDAAAAVALLNRMALVADDGFETLLPAAELLGKYGKRAEAADFLRQADPGRAMGLRRQGATGRCHRARRRRSRAIAGGRRPRFAGRLQIARGGRPDGRYQCRQGARGSGAGSRGRALGHRARAPLLTLRESRRRHETLPGGGADRSRAGDLRCRASSSACGRRRWPSLPRTTRVRMGTLRAAIASGRDSLALALEQDHRHSQYGTPILPEDQLPDDEHAAIAESLAGAAERLDDLVSAQNQLGSPINLRPRDQRDALERRAPRAQCRKGTPCEERRPAAGDQECNRAGPCGAAANSS